MSLMNTNQTDRVERLIISIVNETRCQEAYKEASKHAKPLDQEVYKSTLARFQTKIANNTVAIVNLIARLEIELKASETVVKAFRAAAQEIAKI